MTRKNVLAYAAVVLLAIALTGGTWALARNTDNPWLNGMHGPRAGYGGMMGPGYADDGPGRFDDGMMGGYGMMGGTSFGIEGTGRVSTVAEAREAAQRFADRLDLTVGEVMEFSDNYYAELTTSSGDLATEVLIDPDSGSVRIEYGPAMMWNTDYGMHSRAAAPANRVSADEAQQIADRWLDRYQDGATTEEPDAFPGYYTLHTLEGGEVTGMLSVNAFTGAVWYHSWHGDFVAMSE